MWDTSGNELDYKVLPSNIYKIAGSFIIVCSYDKRESLDTLPSWIEHVKKYFNIRNIQSSNLHLIPVIVLINKCDMKKERKFKICDVAKITDEYNLNILIYEVSAKENIKLDYIFEKVSAILTGSVSILNESALDSTRENNMSAGRERKERGRSFQLQKPQQVESFNCKDREAGQGGSCCQGK
jgi:GTPase SAR1 family protein